MRRALIWAISLLAVGIILLLGWFNRYNIYDWYRLYDYNPPTAVIQLANADTMTPYARKLFYVYHPLIENSADFNENCKVTEQAIVLGCTVIDKGIYIYNISDMQLNGVEQVTAAHEMLHVVYSRLSKSELSYINNLVMSTYNKLAPSDPMLKSEYESYLKTEGASAVPNEMHSVLGTEISNLPKALENYYSQFFTDRQAIVNYANQYEGVFLQRQQLVQQDDQQLAEWRQLIGADETTLSAKEQQLNTQLDQLNQLKSSGQGLAYNNELPSYNTAVDSYDVLLNQTKTLISNYNILVASRNTIALSENQLVQSISSLPAIIPKQ